MCSVGNQTEFFSYEMSSTFELVDRVTPSAPSRTPRKQISVKNDGSIPREPGVVIRTGCVPCLYVPVGDVINPYSYYFTATTESSATVLAFDADAKRSLKNGASTTISLDQFKAHGARDVVCISSLTLPCPQKEVDSTNRHFGTER